MRRHPRIRFRNHAPLLAALCLVAAAGSVQAQDRKTVRQLFENPMDLGALPGEIIVGTPRDCRARSPTPPSAVSAWSPTSGPPPAAS